MIFFFHRICDNCGGDGPAPSISPSELNAFLDWLTSPSSGGAVVKTVAQVIKNDTQAPTSSITCGGAACSSGWYGGPVSVSLSATDAGTSGVAMIRYTTDGSEPTAASPPYTGPSRSPRRRRSSTAPGTTPTTSRPRSRARSRSTHGAGLVDRLQRLGLLRQRVLGAVRVTLSATTAGDRASPSIRYTTDGSDPTLSSPTYSAPSPSPRRRRSSTAPGTTPATSRRPSRS